MGAVASFVSSHAISFERFAATTAATGKRAHVAECTTYLLAVMHTMGNETARARSSVRHPSPFVSQESYRGPHTTKVALVLELAAACVQVQVDLLPDGLHLASAERPTQP
eukprot:7151705-Pyramimonas_sp.AAC.1